ncbi:hypothetical protein O7A70_29490 [Mesorhizobium sp. Cs1299R1N1]|uniref:hypothetical protein n=1 Tax=Mesorhizobium sp. Cs1299R1N1 TaxID=3015172 RepID=UPI00301DA0BB
MKNSAWAGSPYVVESTRRIMASRRGTFPRTKLQKRRRTHLIVEHGPEDGFFDQHYHSSIPYRLEEECRMAYAVLNYARRRGAALSLYSLGTAEGTMARTLSEFSDGQILSLSCSPNPENYKSFMARVFAQQTQADRVRDPAPQGRWQASTSSWRTQHSRCHLRLRREIQGGRWRAGSRFQA